MKKEYGGLLVACQFLLLLLLVATTDWCDITLPALLFFIASLLLAGWAVKVMRLGHFNVLPTIRSGAILITHGPYRYIRHPMYASLLLGGLGLLLITFSWLRLAGFLALWLVLYLKVRIEEKLLADYFPGYTPDKVQLDFQHLRLHPSSFSNTGSCMYATNGVYFILLSISPWISPLRVFRFIHGVLCICRDSCDPFFSMRPAGRELQNPGPGTL